MTSSVANRAVEPLSPEVSESSTAHRIMRIRERRKTAPAKTVPIRKVERPSRAASFPATSEPAASRTATTSVMIQRPVPSSESSPTIRPSPSAATTASAPAITRVTVRTGRIATRRSAGATAARSVCRATDGEDTAAPKASQKSRQNPASNGVKSKVASRMSGISASRARKAAPMPSPVPVRRQASDPFSTLTATSTRTAMPAAAETAPAMPASQMRPPLKSVRSEIRTRKRMICTKVATAASPTRPKVMNTQRRWRASSPGPGAISARRGCAARTAPPRPKATAPPSP